MKRILLLASLGAATLLAQTISAGTFTVNTTSDTHSTGFTAQGAATSTAATDSGGNISLRSALEFGSTLGGSTTINLPPGTYNLSLGDLIAGEQANTAITIQGTGTPANTTINQAQAHRLVFTVNYSVDANVVFTLANVTVSGGTEDGTDPDGYLGNGGAILAGGSFTAPGNAVTLNNVVFTANTAVATTGNASGGAIDMTGGGDLTVANCTFSNNHAGVTGEGAGGAIYFDADINPGNVTILNSTFANNGATGTSIGDGGAIHLASANGNTFSISQCTFTGNSAGLRGGAIDLESGHLTATFNRITGNTAPTGSGIFVAGGGTGWVDARDNWWGGNGGPNTAGSDSTVPTSSTTPPLAGQISFNPWLQLTHTASPNPVTVANATTLTASFLLDSAGIPIASGNLGALIGLPILFNTPVLGSLSGAQPAIQSGGTATATFNAGTATGTGHANAVVDNGVATATFAIQAGPATHFTVSAPASATAGNPFSVTVTALDQFNNTATGYRGTVHFTKSDSGAGSVLPANYTFVAGDNGVHTFSNGATLVTVGSQSVTATDTVTGTITGSATVSVSPAAATHLTVSAPANATGGTAFNVTVKALDAFNNTATGYRGTVHLLSTDTQATVPADYTFVAGDNGSHVLSVTLKTGGNQTITATDTVTSSITGTSSSIFVCLQIVFVDGANGNDGNDGGTLTQAKQTIQAGIDSACAGATVSVSAGTYTPTAPLMVNKDLSIIGAGANTTTVSGSANGGNSVFEINSVVADPGPAVLLSGLTVRDGNTAFGGGILNQSNSTLTVINCTISANQSSGDPGGGGVYNFGILNIGNSTISNNQAVGGTGSGGGIFTSGTLSLTNSTVSGNNTLSLGGGILLSNGVLTVANSTISGNEAGLDGGGIYQGSGTLTIAEATITGNRGTNSSGGLFVTGSDTLENSIVAGNFSGSGTTPSDIGGGLVNTASHDLIGDAATAGGIVNGVNGNIVGNGGSGTININTVLNPTLANNGGPTLTHALVPASLAIDAGAPLNEIQQVTVSGSSGTFTLTFSGQTTAALAFNATAAQVQSALNALASIGGVGGSVTVAVNGSDYAVTFGGTLANSDESQLVATGAGGATVTVATVLNGGLPATDQRGTGFPRVFNTTVDLGAYELSPDLTPTGGFTIVGTEGALSTAQTVATFTDRLGPSGVASYSATIDWGDGAPTTSGTITLAGNTFTVQGSHTYAEQGAFTITVTMMHGTTPAVTATSSANISDPPVAATGGFTVTGDVGVPLSSQTLATFTDPGGAEPAADYSATIDWGDGTLTAGIITAGSGTFTVTGPHTYAANGLFTIIVNIAHETAPIVPVSSTAFITAASTTSLNLAPNPSVFGQPATLTATVSPVPPAGGTPTGTVTFLDGATVIGLAPLNGGGQASLTTSILAVGTHNLSAVYSGDSNFKPSTSPAAPQTVNQAATTATVVSAPNPSLFGQPVSITATVTAVAPGAGTPTGVMAFLDGATPLGTAPLDGTGHASLTISTLAAGAHNLTAVYPGDGNFKPSTSSNSPQVVNQAATTTAVASLVNPSLFGQSVGFTATVAAVAPGAGTPTGPVAFFDGATLLGTVPLNGSGHATFTTSTLALGTHNVTAVYSGDSNFTGSTSPNSPQLVNQAATTTTVASSVNPSIFGQSVTLTATVSAVAPGTGTPTGTVSFHDGASLLGTLPVNGSGHATFTTSTLATGTHNLTAAYSGDGNFTASTSPATSQVVGQPTTTTSVASSANPSIFGQSVTFTATVNAVQAGAGTPTGTVTFSVDGTTVASVSLNAGGQATFTTSTLSIGSHNLSVAYLGDGKFEASTVTLAQTVSCVSPVYVDATSGNDANPGTTPAQAKQTIQAALDAACVGGKVVIKAGRYTPTATLQINKDLSVFGDGASTTIVSGTSNGGHSVFTIGLTGASSGPTVLLSGLSVRDANIAANGGGILNNTNASLTVSNSTILGNIAASGGGIYNAGTLTIDQTMISSNAASAGSSAGALYNAGTLTVNLCTLNANSASSTNDGGALYNSGIATINQSTISGNSVQSGAGAILSVAGASLFVNQSTISGNASVAAAGGIASSGTLAVKNTIVSGNTGGDVTGSLSADSANNLIGLPAGVTSITQILNPTLADNGGPTLTLALVADSPAIDAGGLSLIPADMLDLNGNGNVTETIPYDQRGAGFARVLGSTVDIGALEFHDTLPPAVVISNPSASLTAGGPVTYTVSYPDSDFKASTLAAGSITLNKTGTANGTIAVSGSGNTRAVTISSITGDGTLGISLAAGTASDTFGNLAPAAGPSTTFLVDNTPPTVSISAPSVSTTVAGPVSYTVTYADVNFSSSTLSASNVTLNATETAAGQIAVSGTGNIRTVTITNITGHGTLGLSVAAGSGVDQAGNLAPAAGPSATFIVNHPPVAGPDTVSRGVTGGVTVPVATLLSNDTDADGDVLTITAVQAPASGKATVSLAAGQVVYTPNAGFTNADTFTYTVSDTRGGTATGTVTVNVITVPSQLAIRYPGGNTVHITVTGIPGGTYTVQNAAALNPATWLTLRTVTMDSQGTFSFDDTISANSRFYRLLSP